MEQKSDGYRIGRLLGKHWLLTGLAVLMALAGLSHMRGADSQPRAARPEPQPAARQYTEEEKRVIAQSAARRAEIAKAEAERAKRCAEGAAQVVADARGAMKAGDPDKGLAILNGCPNLLTEARAKAVHNELVAAGRAKADKAAKLALANQKRIEKAQLAARKKEGVSIGMTTIEAVQSSWGKPERINRSTNASGTSEQWVYPGSHNYLYFTDGVLTSIQN